MSAAPFAADFARQPLLTKINASLLVLAVGVLSALLWPAWRGNPDLSHGLFMPIVFLVLLHESRTTGTPRYLPSGGRTSWGGLTALFAGLLALAAAGLYAAALGWSHALVNFMLVLALVLMLGSGLFSFSTNASRLVPFNWNALVAIGLWLLSAPMPLGTYTRLTLALQLWVSENVLRALHVLGIAAYRQGNIIQLAGGTVGVEEACSGVRSLISCVFAAFFFSATLVRRPWARAVVILLAVPLALAMNFLRSLILTLLTNAGTDITGAWHDVTGYAVLAVTAVLLGALALWLQRGPSPPQASSIPIAVPSAPRDAHSAGANAGSASPAWLSAGLGCALALVVMFYANTHASPRTEEPVPNLLAILPANAMGWQVKTTDDLYRFASQLKTDHLAQRTYAKGAESQPIEITVYLAYWRAGQASVSQVASHTPDACWPGGGWEVVPQAIQREQPNIGGRRLATAESRLFKYGSFPQHVWFWHLYEGRPIMYESPYSPRALLQIAWRYGFRHEGDQLFVRVSSNVPWNKIEDEPLLAEIFARLQPLGL